MKKFLLMLTALLTFFTIDAQVSNSYSFLKTTGTYTPLVNKTIFQSGTQLNTDEISGPITLPFTFKMYGNVENTIYITNNGFIGFATPPIPTAKTVYNAISSSNMASKEVISCSNQIIAAQVGNPEISYGSLNGDFVVQFQDVAIVTAPASRMTFQFILKADGKTVQIMFGPNCKGQDQTSNISIRTFEIGLRGPQTPRTMLQNGVLVVYATPITEVYNNLAMVSGDWNTFQPNTNYSGGILIGKSSSSGVSIRTGVNMPPTVISNLVTVPNSGLTYQWIAN